MTAVLASPKFIYRTEPDPQPLAADAHPVGDFVLASRLSYFLWGSMPDEELFGLANQGKLAANLAAQTRRMLKDPRSQYLVTGFGLQWLQIRRLAPRLARPDAIPGVRRAAARVHDEGDRVVLRRDRARGPQRARPARRGLHLPRPPLAKLYGIYDTPSRGPGEFVRVTLPKGDRGGILTQASILTATSNPTRTSP